MSFLLSIKRKGIVHYFSICDMIKRIIYQYIRRTAGKGGNNARRVLYNCYQKKTGVYIIDIFYVLELIALLLLFIF